MRFEFATAAEIVFGWGRISELGRRAHALGHRALLVTGSRPERADRAKSQLESVGIEAVIFGVATEPTTTMIERGVELARASGSVLVLGVGGGSVLDTAKAIAALAPNTGDLIDYLEVVGKGQPLTRPGHPCIAIPTTAGTGSEVTKNAVILAVRHSVKVSLRGLNLLPRLALVDPELTVTVPPEITAATGLDALTQVIEPYLCVARGPMTDALCLEGMRRAARSIRRAFEAGDDRQARCDMAVTSLFGGLALANAKLGAVHGFAAPLGGLCGAPHGAICARLLPLVMHANLRAIRAAHDSELLNRFDEIARALTGQSAAQAIDGINWLESLVEDLKIPRLGSFGVTATQVDTVVEQARNASSMKGNPVELSKDVLAAILEKAI